MLGFAVAGLLVIIPGAPTKEDFQVYFPDLEECRLQLRAWRRFNTWTQYVWNLEPQQQPALQHWQEEARKAIQYWDLLCDIKSGFYGQEVTEAYMWNVYKILTPEHFRSRLRIYRLPHWAQHHYDDSLNQLMPLAD